MKLRSKRIVNKGYFFNSAWRSSIMHCREILIPLDYNNKRCQFVPTNDPSENKTAL